MYNIKDLRSRYTLYFVLSAEPVRYETKCFSKYAGMFIDLPLNGPIERTWVRYEFASALNRIIAEVPHIRAIVRNYLSLMPYLLKLKQEHPQKWVVLIENRDDPPINEMSLYLDEISSVMRQYGVLKGCPTLAVEFICKWLEYLVTGDEIYIQNP